MRTTFIYVLNDPRDGRLRYVGKADDPLKRWYQHLSTSESQDHRGAWIRSLLAVGLKPELEVLEEIPHEGWQEIEREYIRVFRMLNMNLVNTSDGGDGNTISTEGRQRISKARKGKPLSSAHRAKLSAAKMGKTNRLGKKHSPEALEKMSLAKRGSKHNFFGKKLSAGHRAKLSKARMGIKFSAATLEKMSYSAKNRKPKV